MRRRVGLSVLAFASLVMLSTANAGELLPDGGIAKAGGRGPVEAWYASPTKRYDHGVLGDSIEAGSLVAIDDKGARHELNLPQFRVFEDITPRLADLDADGRNEIITIRTDLDGGAAVAVYGIRGNVLSEVAATKVIGLPHRWLSIAAIGNFLGKGRLEIAIIKTPHIGGRLEILALRDGKLKSLFRPYSGFTTHVIGSRQLSLAAAGDINADGVDELVLPSQDRKQVVALDLKAGVKRLFARTLPARISQPIAIEGRHVIRIGLENGDTLKLSVK